MGANDTAAAVPAESLQAVLRQASEHRRLIGLCASISDDRAAAEDLAQETLLEAWRNLHKLRDAAGADRWLTAIARNAALSGVVVLRAFSRPAPQAGAAEACLANRFGP